MHLAAEIRGTVVDWMQQPMPIDMVRLAPGVEKDPDFLRLSGMC